MITYQQLMVFQQRQAIKQVAEIPGFTKFDVIEKFQYIIDASGNISGCVYMGISKQAQKDLAVLRKEMKKANPSTEKIFNLLCGTKYNKPMS